MIMDGSVKFFCEGVEVSARDALKSA
jgi:hypothetical protein